MVQRQYAEFFFIVCILELICIPMPYAGCNKVTLLTTEGATTDLKWRVENWNNPVGFTGWEDMSMPHEDKVLRGYQICEIHHISKANGANKPETWLLLPEMNINGISRVFIEMNFTMRECSDIQKTCRETFSVYYRTSGKPNDAIKFHPKLFKKIDTVAAEERFSPNIKNNKMNHEEVDISFGNSSQNVYLYIAVVDAGACVALMGVRVYYKVCRETVTGFATFQETKTGASDTSLMPIIGTCVPHSMYRDRALPIAGTEILPTSIKSLGPLYHCTSSGDWQVNTGSCQCVAGYEPNKEETECIPCKLGMYKLLNGNSPCIFCPENSGTLVPGSVFCQCDSGYRKINPKNNKSRSSSKECIMCSKLPGPPQELDTSVENSNDPGRLVLSWKRPVDYGGCSKVFYYIICNYATSLLTGNITDQDNGNCSHVEYFPSFWEVSGQKVVVKNLQGHSLYNFTVFAYTRSTMDGMSQDLSNILFGEKTKLGFNSSEPLHIWWQNQEFSNLLRHSSSHILHRTSDTLPSSVNDLTIKMENEAAIVVTWKQPTYPNGIILFYTVWYMSDMDSDNDASEFGQNSGDPSLWMQIKTNITQAILADLTPQSTYQIFVKVHNSAGSDNGSAPLLATTLPQNERSVPHSKNFPYIIATIVVAILIVVVCIILFLQWKCRSGQEKGGNQNGSVEEPAQFRPYNSQHQTLDQRTYVDPFCLDSLPNHQFLCETSSESITTDDVIGCGEFGEVYKGTLATIDLKTGQETTIDVAVKRLKNQCKPEEQKSFFQEARSLEKFRHPNVVHLEAVVTSTRPFIIVTEFMANGSLQGYLTKLRAKAEAEQVGMVWKLPLSHETMVKMLYGVAKGMEYLVGRGYVHRDLAARNVLVSSDMVCKVADFGLLREFDKKDSEHGSNGSGTYTTSGGKIAIKWTAPEAIAFRTFTQFSDVWSFGILMWEAVSYGEKPYWDCTNDEVIKAVNEGMRLPAPNRCPSVLHQLMLKCWQRDHLSRPTFTEIISQLHWMLSEENVLDLPASPASCGQPGVFFDDETNSVCDEVDASQISENLLAHDGNYPDPSEQTIVADPCDLLSDTENELSDSDDETIRSYSPDEEGSEVSSCTSTICASEITVCAGNGSAAYVPLLRSDSDSEGTRSSRSGTPTGHYYSLHR